VRRRRHSCRRAAPPVADPGELGTPSRTLHIAGAFAGTSGNAGGGLIGLVQKMTAILAKIANLRREKTGLQAANRPCAGDSPSVRHVLVDGKPGPHPAPKLRGSGCIFDVEQAASDPCQRGRSRRQHAQTRLDDHRVGCLDDVSLRTLGLCDLVPDLSFPQQAVPIRAAESPSYCACYLIVTSIEITDVPEVFSSLPVAVMAKASVPLYRAFAVY
jgi:hypothetical protein